MKIQLERLPHQIEALQAINKDFYGVDTTTNNPDAGYIYANPILNYAYCKSYHPHAETNVPDRFV